MVSNGRDSSFRARGGNSQPFSLRQVLIACSTDTAKILRSGASNSSHPFSGRMFLNLCLICLTVSSWSLNCCAPALLPLFSGCPDPPFTAGFGRAACAASSSCLASSAFGAKALTNSLPLWTQKAMLRPDEVGQVLAVSVRTVRRLVARGELAAAASSPRGPLRVLSSSLVRLLAA